MALRDIIRRPGALLGALLGLSAYERPTGRAAEMPSLGDEKVESARASRGGQLTPPPTTQSEWYLADIEEAERLADGGDLSYAARLMRHVRRDGVLSGVLSTRTDGVVRLPKVFRGDAEIVRELESQAGAVRSTFDEMFPPAELALLEIDGIFLGVGVGEMKPVPGRAHPQFTRLDPEWLRFDWSLGVWFYRSLSGDLPITPGDGRWILHTPGGRRAPWNCGLWKAASFAVIRKENSARAKGLYETTLANAAVVAEAPVGASDAQAKDFFTKIAGAWGFNTLFGLRPGYKLSILESNGRGFESFQKTIAESNTEIMICVAGQTVTVDGGTGFANADVHKSIRADLIQASADGLAYTINTQGLPCWIISKWGLEVLLRNPATVAWDVTPPRDLAQKATALGQVATAVTALVAAYGERLDLEALAGEFGIPLRSPGSVPATAPQPTTIPAVN